jgi:hypothetical protein
MAEQFENCFGNHTLHLAAIVAMLTEMYVHASAGPFSRSRQAAGDRNGMRESHRGDSTELRQSDRARP